MSLSSRFGKVIEDCLEGKDSEFWETVDLSLLESEIVKHMNMLISVNDSEKYIKRLADLLQKVDTEKSTVAKFLQPKAPPPPPEPMKDKAFDAGQGKALLEMTRAVNDGTITSMQADIMAAIMFPGVDKKLIGQMMKPAAPPQGALPGAVPPGGSQGTPNPATAGSKVAGEDNANG